MTEVMSASPAPGGHGFHRSASSTTLSSATLLPRSASTGSLNSLKKSRTQLHTKIVPPSPPPSPKIQSHDPAFHFDINDGFDSGLCLDDEIFLPIYDYDTSPPDELHTSHLAVESVPDSSKEDSTRTGSAVETPEVVVTAVDDNALKIEPSRHVDYLSHEWTEEEIASSWRYMVGKRNMYEYSARLENASWRTWAKSKFNLSTISPKKLNWSKECDVTWLYGPLSRGEEKISSTVKATDGTLSEEGRYSPPINDNNQGYAIRPILKKRSMSEVMLAKSLSSSSLLKQATAAIQSQDSEKGRFQNRPLPSRAVSDFGNIRRQPTLGAASSDFPTALASGSYSPTSQRHISFNDQVQQCIAVEVDKDEIPDDGPIFNIGPDEDDSSSDSDAALTMGVRPTASRTPSSRSFSDQKTIAMLPSTTLKAIEEPIPKRSMSFANGLTSFFLGSSTPKPAPKLPADPPSTSVVPPLPEYTNLPPIDSSTSQYTFTDSDSEIDDELAELNWGSSVFANRRDSISLARPRFHLDSTLSPAINNEPISSASSSSGSSSSGSNGYGRDGAFGLGMGSGEVYGYAPGEEQYGEEFAYEEDEDDAVAAGLFGRAVDAVNTAKDIAHVIWNVGWRA